MQREAGIELWHQPSGPNLPPCCLTWCRSSEKFLFFYFVCYCPYLFLIFVMYLCRSALINWCSYCVFYRVGTLPLCLYVLDVILFVLLLWQLGACSLKFGLALRSHGTWSCGLIQWCSPIEALSGWYGLKMPFLFFAQRFYASTCPV
jgi:hypothetical protein